MVVEDVYKMHGSNNYHDITVHYGVKQKIGDDIELKAEDLAYKKNE